MNHVPSVRVRACNQAQERPEREYILYWMIAARRTTWNYGLEHAARRAAALRKPLLVLEALRSDYPWASDRLHRFVLEGMADNAARCARAGVRYHAYVEPERGAGRGLLAALAERAALVVTDEFPAFFLPRMMARAAAKLDVRLEAVDSNGLLPLASAPREFATAYAFRRFLQKTLPEHLRAFPSPDPLRAARSHGQAVLPKEVLRRWPFASQALLRGDEAALAELPIDHTVPPVAVRGGSLAAGAVLESFLDILPRYADEHSAPEAEVTSGLSPYLHFGHLSAHAVVAAALGREGWTPRDLAPKASGKREGWWGTSAATESFLDELVTWRELGFNVCSQRADFDRWESLPAWAQATLDAHAGDRRAYKYDLKEFEEARTHDPLWNAAQRQLRREGAIHNTMRMLWGKKILEWTSSPRAALAILIELNNKWAVDGRDPNSYTGIFWVLGRHDRPWAPERPIFGVVRWMSSANMARKHRVRGYLERYAAEREGAALKARSRESQRRKSPTKARSPKPSRRAGSRRSTGASA